MNLYKEIAWLINLWIFFHTWNLLVLNMLYAFNVYCNDIFLFYGSLWYCLCIWSTYNYFSGHVFQKCSTSWNKYLIFINCLSNLILYISVMVSEDAWILLCTILVLQLKLNFIIRALNKILKVSTMSFEYVILLFDCLFLFIIQYCNITFCHFS
jgi:hypothetical protein